MPGYTRIIEGAFLSEASWNANFDAMERVNLNIIGRGVLSGLLLSAGAGLTLNIASGVLNSLMSVALASRTATAPDDATSYVWISEAGAVTFSASTADPGSNLVCLGKVVTASGAISSVDNTSATGRRMFAPYQVTAWTHRFGPAVFDQVNAKVDLTGTLNATVAVNSDGTIRATGKGSFDYLVLPDKSAGTPVEEADKQIIYGAEVDGNIELHVKQPDGTERQLTTGNGSPMPGSAPLTAKTAAYTITTADIGKCFTNTGATAEVEFTLPAGSAVPNQEYEFAVTDNDGMKIFPVGTDVIRLNETDVSGTGAGGGFVDSNDVGSTMRLKWVGAAWMAFGPVGPWAAS